MKNLNNHGQTLIVFVVLLPILITLLAVVVDTSYMYREKIKLESVTKTTIKNLYDERLDSNIESKIKKLYKKNKIDCKNLKVEATSNYFIIKNNYEIDSIFGKIIGLKKYKIKTSLKGYIKEDKIKIAKE